MQLSEEEFFATMEEPMRRLSQGAEIPFDFWNYFEAIPLADFAGVDCSAGVVTYVWEHPDGNFQHVLVDSEQKNVFMVLVLDLTSRSVLGHRLLNIGREYGIDPSSH